MLTLLLLLSALPAFADSGYVKIPSGHELYVNYQKAEPGKPTFVLVNGLVYDLDRWHDLAEPLARRGYGVLRYYFRGQLKTLRRELALGRPEFFRKGLSQKDFANELAELMDQLQIKQATVVGLSFGAAIAAEFGQLHPGKIDQLVFLAPLVIPLDRYDSNGAWIHGNLEALRFAWGPFWGSYVYDYYYNLIFRSYLGQRLVPERIPSEMADVADDYKESIFHQVRATRDFDLRTYSFSRLPGRVHLVLASREEEPALKDQFRAWEAFGQSQASLVYLSPSSHAIPDAAGAFTAKLLEEFAGATPRFHSASAFYASTEKKTIEGMGSARALEERALAEPREKNK